MEIKTITKETLTEDNKEEIIKLIDIFRKPKGKESITKKTVEWVLSQKSNTVFVALEDNKIIGMATLIEENFLIAKNRKMDLLKLDTTPNSPANRLYENCGFSKKEASLYKLYL